MSERTIVRGVTLGDVAVNGVLTPQTIEIAVSRIELEAAARHAGLLPAILSDVSVERAGGLRALQGTRISMGGLRLAKQIVIRENDVFRVGSALIVKPDELVPLVINGYGTACARENNAYQATTVGFRIERAHVIHGSITLSTGNRGHVHLLGDVLDAVVENDGGGDPWIVLEPVVIPPPRTFPAEAP